jgi:hypothetical protein
MTDQAPLTKELTADVPAATIAATQDQTIGEAPFAGEVTAVSLISEGAVTANATNYRTFTVVNKGQDGSGSTVVATLALDTPTTDDLAAKDEKAFVLSAVEHATEIAEGDVLIVSEAVTASGLAHSGYQIKVVVDRS